MVARQRLPVIILAGRRIGVMSSWWLDLKLGVRMLGKYPGLALAGVAGIAMAVAIAAGGWSVMVRASRLPLDEGERVVAIEWWDTAANAPERRAAFDWRRWRDELRQVRDVSAFRTFPANWVEPGVIPDSVPAAAMSASGFAVARVAPLRGRVLAESDEREGAAPVVVIAERVWRNRLGSDPAVLGRVIQLGSVSYTVVGVMPENFAFPVNQQFWVPLRRQAGQALMVFGRLAPGATLPSARSELAAVAGRIATEQPRAFAPLRAQLLPYPYPLLKLHQPEDWAGLWATQGALVSLLVLVCLNVAILVFTRTAMRQEEIALRTALGASRGRIVWQLFLEALVLAGLAAGVGLAIAGWALRQVTAATLPLMAELPYWVSFGLTLDAVWYAAALSVLAAAIVGVLPAWQATRVLSGARVSASLRMGRTWTVLIVAQVAFAVALLPPAVGSAGDGVRLATANPGFAAERFLSARIEGPGAGELLRRLEEEPRLERVTFGWREVGDEAGASMRVDEEVHAVRLNRVDAAYFRVFDVPLLAGRALQPDDPAVLVNLPLAQRLFGGHAVGRRIELVDGGSFEIAGVVPEFPTGVSVGMRDSPMKVYRVLSPEEAVHLALRVRDGSPMEFAARLRALAAAVHPDLLVREVRSLEEALRKEQWIRRLEASVMLAVTVSVLLLSSMGVYALMAFTVAQRRKEIGIRMALGASARGILASVFSRALWQLALGAVFGALVGAGLAPSAGVVFVVTLAIMAVGFVAALGPARASLRVEPVDVLRAQ